MAASARSAALAGLKAQRTQGTWPDQFVKNQLPGFALERKDAALAARLLYGVLQNQQLIDFYLAQYSKIKLNKIAPQVLDVLRLGVYQIAFLDKIPAWAAVNESVNLARKKGGQRAAAFVNGLLRAVAAQSQAGYEQHWIDTVGCRSRIEGIFPNICPSAILILCGMFGR